MNKKGIAILGYGVVGKGVYEIASKREDCSVLAVFDLPIKKDELGDLLVSDIESIANNKDIDIVFECLGGDALPYMAITSCLRAGKSVITSNKETVSKHLKEYDELAEANNCSFRYEASVGGGIPLLNTVMNIAYFDEINSFIGILNGTGNYILTKIAKEGVSFEDALKEAQAKGFAEANPAADLEGMDLLRKATILSSLAFKKYFSYEDVPNFGIQNLNSSIIEAYSKDGYLLKFGCQGVKAEEGISVIACPFLVKGSHPLSTIDYEFNSVVLDCKNNSRITLSGKGAGSLPTASAMMQDYVYITSSLSYKKEKKESGALTFQKAKFFVYDGEVSKYIEASSLDELKVYSFVAKVIGE